MSVRAVCSYYVQFFVFAGQCRVRHVSSNINGRRLEACRRNIFASLLPLLFFSSRSLVPQLIESSPQTSCQGEGMTSERSLSIGVRNASARMLFLDIFLGNLSMIRAAIISVVADRNSSLKGWKDRVTFLVVVRVHRITTC
jgi:hypothetical protein